jgi:hypothetical protein
MENVFIDFEMSKYKVMPEEALSSKDIYCQYSLRNTFCGSKLFLPYKPGTC